MIERERLIKLTHEALLDMIEKDIGDPIAQWEYIADYLLDHGMIVPPCKVGDTVYVLDIYPDSRKCADCGHYYPGGVGDIPACEASEDWKRRRDCIEIHKEIVHRRSTLIWLIGNDFGRTVFLTREEAEAALAERHKSQ